MRLTYRVQQFWDSLRLSPGAEEISEARQVLSPALMDLFRRMQPGEQAHSLKVFRSLVRDGADDIDLLQAALLHDVGKSLHPLWLWERVLIVLAKAVFPAQAWRWGQGAARGWRRALVVAQQHPEWGARLAEEAGASPRAVALIRRHQEPSGGVVSINDIDHLLRMLQACDNKN